MKQPPWQALEVRWALLLVAAFDVAVLHGGRAAAIVGAGAADS